MTRPIEVLTRAALDDLGAAILPLRRDGWDIGLHVEHDEQTDVFTVSATIRLPVMQMPIEATT